MNEALALLTDLALGTPKLNVVCMPSARREEGLASLDQLNRHRVG